MLKKLKSLFVIEEDTPEEKLNNKIKPKEKQPSAKSTSSAKTSPAKASSSPVSNTPLNTSGKVSSKFLNALLKAMDENDLDGFDYLEYKQSLQSLSKMSMDEATRYQSAFAMAQTMGANAKHLNSTATHYLNILLQEEKKFKQALVNQRSRQINDKEEEIKRLNMTITSHKKQIEKLNQEINSYTKKMNVLTNNLSASEAKLEATKNDFLVTYKKLVDQIQTDIDKMNQYLK